MHIQLTYGGPFLIFIPRVIICFPAFPPDVPCFQTGNVPDGAEWPRGGLHFCRAGRAAHRYTKPGDAAARLQPQVSRAQACGSPRLRYGGWWCADKKENGIFLTDKEIHMGSVAKSLMWKGFLIFEEMRKYLTIYEEAVSPRYSYMTLQPIPSEFPYV
jgi:hypothetical protein